MNKIKYLFFSLLFLGMSFQQILKAEIVESIYYFVNSGIISKTDFENRYELFLKDPISQGYDEAGGKVFVISNLILDKLVDQELYKQGIPISKSDVDNQIDQTVQNSGMRNLEDFKQAIKRSLDMEYEDYVAIVKRKMSYSTLINKLVNVPPPTPREIDEYYQKHKEDKFKLETPIYNLSMIYLEVPNEASFSVRRKVEKKMLEIVDKIKNQELTFEQAAQEYSENPSGEIGGEIGWVDLEKGAMSPLEKQMISGLRVGEITKPVAWVRKAERGLVVYQLNAKQEEGYYPYHLASKISREEIVRKRSEFASYDLIRDMIASSYIKLNTDALDYLPNLLKNP